MRMTNVIDLSSLLSNRWLRQEVAAIPSFCASGDAPLNSNEPVVHEFLIHALAWLLHQPSPRLQAKFNASLKAVIAGETDGLLSLTGMSDLQKSWLDSLEEDERVILLNWTREFGRVVTDRVRVLSESPEIVRIESATAGSTVAAAVLHVLRISMWFEACYMMLLRQSWAENLTPVFYEFTKAGRTARKQNLTEGVRRAFNAFDDGPDVTRDELMRAGAIHSAANQAMYSPYVWWCPSHCTSMECQCEDCLAILEDCES